VVFFYFHFISALNAFLDCPLVFHQDLFSTILHCQYNKRFIVNALNEALKSLNRAIKLSYLYFEHLNAAQNPHFVV
jgi:hypothetical protein